MSRTVIALAFACTTVIAAGCATPAAEPELGSLDSEAIMERVRTDVRLEPLLNDSRVTLTERDGAVVFGGSVASLQDMNIVRDIVREIEDADGEEAVANEVVMIGES